MKKEEVVTTTTTKNEAATKTNQNKNLEKYAMEFTCGVQISVKASSSNLHMARVREVPY
jgi:hypothetical protein